MRVAVVTPYYKEPLEYLEQCAKSVREQSHPCAHIMVADGHPRSEIDGWNVVHVKLPIAHGAFGNMARAIGSIFAMEQRFDAIANLDADNWYYPEHVSRMVDMHEKTGAEVCAASVNIHRLDGSYLERCKQTDGINHVDTSAMFVTEPAFEAIRIWREMPPQLGAIGDRVVWNYIKFRKFKCAFCSIPTVAYRTSYAGHYLERGERLPAGVSSHHSAQFESMRWWASLPQAERERWEQKLKIRIQRARVIAAVAPNG